MTETGTPDVGFIKKRDGRSERFDGAKIVEAMRRAFEDVADEQAAARGLIAGHGASVPAVSADELEALLASIEQAMDRDGVDCVEGVQDLVERALMERGHFEVAKSYILYRHERAEKRAVRVELARAVAGLGGGIACEEGLVAAGVPSAADDDATIAPKDYLVEDLDRTLARIQRDFDDPAYDLAMLSARFRALTGAGQDADARLGALIRAAVELTSQEAPRWEMIAARLLDLSFMRHLAATRRELGIASFGELVRYLTERGLYGDYILASYSVSELEEAAAFMVSERDELFAYSGLDLLINRYVIRAHDHTPLESPQEMFLGIALHLAMNEEPTQRLAWVKRFYDMLSKLEVTMATPTLSNARKPDHQLSSCFIDTVPDSLVGIYRSIDNFAQVSKYGGGMGMYLGKVRATGGSIRGFEGVAGGVIRWIRVINDTAVAVDQLGMRQGAVAVYLDAWHRDLPEFLNLRTNNGDDRMKAHDIFPAVCYPDLFWKMAKEDLNQLWYLFCPHEVMKVKGYCLEDCFGDEWEQKYLDCVQDSRLSKRAISIKDIVRLVLRSSVETGTPFIFNRDTVNRANPNAHQGMIYCSNLCTEIAQNMSPIDSVSSEIRTAEGDTVVVKTMKPGDFVVCNLASLSLGHLPLENTAEMEDKIATVVRALDNVIDLNLYPVPYAQISNQRYRSIGLGVSGYHHALALRGIRWESEEHLAFADRLFEQINFAAIQASTRLAREKGRYACFEGSDWQTGAYFEKRGYQSERWQHLAAEVAEQGMRNAYLLAIAPTSSTSIIAGTTAGIDPVMKRFFLEEKKGAMLPRVAPALSDKTWWIYKDAHLINQTWSVRAAGVRQRHIDQAQSLNLYITNEFTMRQLLNLYILAWESGVKTIYYVRSKSLEVAECESCAS